jgi:hypothetical protein
MCALLVSALMAGLIAVPAASAATPRPKVVIVVGPVGGSTAEYIASGRQLAKQARSYGAAVTELYTPNATWARVLAATKNANLLIYLGHGNGTPSAYTNRPESTNGMGLNAAAGRGNSNTKYYGSTFVTRYIRLAPNAVVILNRLCYASGNNEWGAGNPSFATARTRVDSYGWSFFKTGAKAVFAEGITSAAYVLTGLFQSNKTIEQIFWSSPNSTRTYKRTFDSSKTPGMDAVMDPYAPSRYYRSVIGDLDLTAADWR